MSLPKAGESISSVSGPEATIFCTLPGTPTDRSVL